MYDYINLIPRYSPILKMSKNLIKQVYFFPQSWNYGPYKVRFWDGIDFPFNVGSERWRVVEEKSYVKFDNRDDRPIKKISFGMINHVMGDTDSSVTVTFKINENVDLQKTVILKPKERKTIEIPINENTLIKKENLIEISDSFKDKTVKEKKSQILAITFMATNDIGVNLESVNMPYVSPLGPAMTGVTYKAYGGLIVDPWKYWEIHTQMFERLPDFWWIRNLYYWDIPKSFTLGLLGVNFLGLFFSVFLLKRNLEAK
jgi:hypothetical protein